MNKERGFSLIEVLIAATIFSIGLIALAGSQLVSLRATQSNYNFTVATSLVEEQLERLRTVGSAGLVNGNDGPLDAFGMAAADYADPPAISNFLFNRSWTCVPSAPGVGVSSRVTCTVTWIEPRTGKTRMASSTTTITP